MRTTQQSRIVIITSILAFFTAFSFSMQHTAHNLDYKTLNEKENICIEYLQDEPDVSWKHYSGVIKYKHCMKGKETSTIVNHLIKMYKTKDYIILNRPGRNPYIKINRKLLKKMNVKLVADF